jgi:hypothetical protein
MSDYPNLLLTGKPISQSYQNLVEFTGSTILVGADGNIFQNFTNYLNTSSIVSSSISSSYTKTASVTPNYVLKVGDTISGIVEAITGGGFQLDNSSQGLVFQGGGIGPFINHADVKLEIGGDGASLMISNASGSVWVSGSTGRGIVSSSIFLGNITGSLFGTSSNLNPYQSLTSVVTSSTNWITASFLSSYYKLIINKSTIYNFTSSNNASSGFVADITLFISNSLNVSSSLSFPNNWVSYGGWPNQISASSTQQIWLRTIDGSNIVYGGYLQS